MRFQGSSGRHTRRRGRRRDAGGAGPGVLTSIPGIRLIPAIILSALLLAAVMSCAVDFGQPVLVTQCSRIRLDAAIISYEDAKDQFAEHFQTRSDTALVYAYHATVDAVQLARSIKTCFDFSDGYKQEAIWLIRTNRVFQRLIMNNLRDPDPEVVIGMFGSRYREIIRNDIN